MSARQVCAAKCGRWRLRAAPSLLLVPTSILLAAIAGCTANVSSVSPTSVTEAGPAFKVTVLGSGFTAGSTVQWNGANRTTTYVSATELVAQINAADIAATGSGSITVTNPLTTGTTSSGSSSGASNAKTISIVAPSIDATDFQIDPAHDGAVTFSSVSFPTAATWSVNLGSGTPSNLVVADSRIFLTIGTSGGSRLLALSQTTGGTSWGPKAIAGTAGGSAGVAYDGGRVFVAEDDSGGSTLYAYDATSGALDWSTALGASSPGAPTAADGYVYVIVSGSATLDALDETTGAIAWQQSLSQASGIPAVTADGVYVTATTSACFAVDLRPATGEVIWDSSGSAGSCPQAATPAVANQSVYSPISSGTAIFATETGGSTGTLSDSLPAAFTSTMAYFWESPNLDAVNLSGNTVQWTFNGDNDLNTPPIIVNGQYVITGSSLGHLYAVDATSGSSVWTQSLTGGVEQVAAGDGLLLAVSETGDDSSGTLTAYTLATNP